MVSEAMRCRAVPISPVVVSRACSVRWPSSRIGWVQPPRLESWRISAGMVLRAARVVSWGSGGGVARVMVGLLRGLRFVEGWLPGRRMLGGICAAPAVR